jgi:predicted Zn-ribbon and HTH transcriptional regulator
MNEDVVREIVRASIARHLGHAGERHEPQSRPLPLVEHASHFRYSLSGSGGACLIEPAVTCNHCGYCESHGY